LGSRALIYGCTGYTGTLIAEKANELAGDVVLAARDAAKVKQLAKSLGRSWRCARLGDPSSLDRILTDVDVVLHAAGPFSATARPMLEACLRTGTHYLDIAGELPVFQSLGQYDDQARLRGIMVMPGVGFAIVATDCLAAHIKARMPRARALRLGISMPKSFSRGSVRTMAELVRDRVTVCRNGKINSIPIGRLERSFDFGEGDRWSTCVNWPDVYTAVTTTGIPNIEVYMEADFLARTVYHAGAFLAAPLQLGISQSLLRAYSDIWPAYPAGDDLTVDRQVIVAEAEDSWRQCARARLTTINGYGFTALAATHILHRVLAGEFSAGFQTPARVYGADFVLGFEGTIREDLRSHACDRETHQTN
jgi:short subunit dehydrogenase-like uncharacterized protein